MTLKDLASVIPGYVTLYVHTRSECWRGSPAESYALGEHPAGATVVNATPLAPYTMEVSVEFKEE